MERIFFTHFVTWPKPCFYCIFCEIIFVKKKERNPEVFRHAPSPFDDAVLRHEHMIPTDFT